LFEWVKFRSHLSRGVTIGTMLKDEAFYFTRLGTFLERADNTARIIDVKFHSVGSDEAPGSQPPQQSQSQSQSQGPANGNGEATAEAQLDYYFWAAILRSVSAFEVYRKVYRDVIAPSRVAELLVLRDDMPRSLLACMNEVCLNLEKVRNSRSRETERRA